jgi:hypothetical protein
MAQVRRRIEAFIVPHEHKYLCHMVTAVIAHAMVGLP